MPDINEVFGGETLKAADLQGREFTLAIATVQAKEFDKGNKLVIKFVGAKKALIANRTNSKRIAMLYGNNTDLWVGRQVTSGDHLSTNQWIVNDAALVSADGRYAAYLQDDANLVLCLTTNRTPDLSRPYWSVFANPASGQVRSQPSGPPYHAVMQSDGNFVLYDGRDPGHSGPPYWARRTGSGRRRPRTRRASSRRPGTGYW